MRCFVLLALLTLARLAHAETEGSASVAADRMGSELADLVGRSDAMLAGGILGGAASLGLGVYAGTTTLATAGGALAGGMLGLATIREVWGSDTTPSEHMLLAAGLSGPIVGALLGYNLARQKRNLPGAIIRVDPEGHVSLGVPFVKARYDGYVGISIISGRF